MPPTHIARLLRLTLMCTFLLFTCYSQAQTFSGIIYGENTLITPQYQSVPIRVYGATLDLSLETITTSTTYNFNAGRTEWSITKTGSSYTDARSFVDLTQFEQQDINPQCVRINDVVKINEHLSGNNSLSPAGTLAADVNQDGIINSIDVMLLEDIVLGQTSSFPNTVNVENQTYSNVNTVFATTQDLSTIVPYQVNVTPSYTNAFAVYGSGSSQTNNHHFHIINIGDVLNQCYY